VCRLLRLISTPFQGNTRPVRPKGTPSQVLLNDGKGHFSTSGAIGDSNFQRVVLGDLDRGGDLDAAIADWGRLGQPRIRTTGEPRLKNIAA
jgi:hypothetical protein